MVASASPTATVGSGFCTADEDCRVNDCHVGFCDVNGVCHSIFLPDELPCDDGDACTHSELCHRGECFGLVIACDDGNACTVDTCDPLLGCANVAVDSDCSDFTEGPEARASAQPTPLTYLDAAPPLVLPPATPPPNDDQFASQVIEGVEQDEGDGQDDEEGGVARGESENEVIARSEFGYGGAVVGLVLVSCAGCCAMFFGVLAAKDLEKDEDRLEMVLDVDEDTVAAVDNEAFVAPDTVPA